MNVHKLKRYDDPLLDRQVEELCAEVRRLTAFVFALLPEYADNAAAIAGGLTAGNRYRTSAGALMEVV